VSDAIRRQLLQRLESLRRAGVELLPRFDPQPAEHLAGESSKVVGPSLDSLSKIELPAAVEPVDAIEQRRVELRLLADRVSKCTRCAELASTRTQTVFGVGMLDPEICFIGEAPGADEDRQGEPFVGAAGQLLNRIIAAMGMKREEVYICNVLRCRPPGNRTPKSEEANNCREFLEAQLELVRPKYICTLGVPAAQNLLKTTMSLSKLRGSFHLYQDIPVVCTYHPASLFPGRSPENKKLVWDDMKMLLTKMGRPIPTGKSAS
jgi:uracil-DNA glycosylase